MIASNQKKIENKKIKGKPGGLANESRFFTTERELRNHKVIIVPSANSNSMIKMEQGWNRKAREKDVVRISIGDFHAIVTREELEQGIVALAQGYEIIKYQPSIIGSGEEFMKKQIDKL